MASSRVSVCSTDDSDHLVRLVNVVNITQSDIYICVEGLDETSNQQI